VLLSSRPHSWMSSARNGLLSCPRGGIVASVGSSRWDISLVGYIVFVVFCLDIH
jgi:hypothetical protein